jgi:hypothetical protein
MSEVFQSEMIINSLQFDTLMKEEDAKKYFKEKLAFQLAHKIIETNRTTFVYTKLVERNAVCLRAKVIL